MNKVDVAFDNLDLRSIRMLKAFLDSRSVTKTAKAVAISQPAASRVLSQLRQALGDPLLVRGRHGNTLTPRAEELRPLVTEAIVAVSALFERKTFEPSTSNLTVRIATTIANSIARFDLAVCGEDGIEIRTGAVWQTNSNLDATIGAFTLPAPGSKYPSQA